MAADMNAEDQKLQKILLKLETDINNIKQSLQEDIKPINLLYDEILKKNSEFFETIKKEIPNIQKKTREIKRKFGE